MAIIITLLFCICLILCFCLFRKHKVDKETELKNQEIARENEYLKQSQTQLKYSVDQLSYEYQRLNNQKIETLNELNGLRDNIQSTISQNKEISNNAFQEYRKTLEIAYNDYERHFDIEMLSLHNQIQETTQELNKLKATRAAAHEALMKEQEIKDNKDNYRLIVPEVEKRDIKLLNSIKKELINERPVNMIIWQTYYSKRANELCSRILGTKPVTGIYKITEISTEKCYIGQSKNIKERFREHMKCGLGIDTPNGNKLYQAMLNSSIEDFTFELIEECNENDLDEKERYFIELYEAYDYGFNSNKGNKNTYKN
jgi:hypothetical protein